MGQEDHIKVFHFKTTIIMGQEDHIKIFPFQTTILLPLGTATHTWTKP